MPTFDAEVYSVVKTLRCLIGAIDQLERENFRLKRRISLLEDLAGELPAPWSNQDGVITEEPGRPIGSATFLLSSRMTGGASALPIDQRVMEELCDKSGGCTLVVSYQELSLFNTSPRESVISGPCQFSYASKDGDWAVGAGCGSDRPSSGVDGDGGVGSDAANSAEIAVAGGACILADSGLSKTVGGDERLASDRSKSLFLIAMPSRQTGAGRRFQCEIALQ